MKIIRFDKVNGHTFFLTPVIGFTKNYMWEEYKIEYRLCFAWFKLHVGILIYSKSQD